jgi:hypothetical protein
MARARSRPTPTGSTPARRRPGNRPNVPFPYKLVLNQWILRLFGVDRLEDLAEHMRAEGLEGWDENGVHHFHHALTSQLFNMTWLSTATLKQYDENIVKHTQRLNERRITHGHEPIVWKYFQYLALLFTEVYLDWYFNRTDELRKALNEQIATYNARFDEPDRVGLLQYNLDSRRQLNKLAFWMATGSGKTLLMHANILQFFFHQKNPSSINRVILLTPNEG